MDGISVILPTLNRTDFVINTIRDMLRQDFDKPFEIIVVDQSVKPDAKVMELAEGQETVKYHHITQFRGLPEARNFGLQHARFDYILYLDDDIEVDSNLLGEHYRIITQPDIGIVAGGITEKNNPNPPVKHTGRFNRYTATPSRGFNSTKEQFVDHAPGGNFSIKKEVMKAAGGCDERLNVGAALYEETDLCGRVKKMGLKIFFNPKAHIIHLAAAKGGCRVPDIDKYIYSLAHNRALIIARHLNALQQVTSTIYLLKMVLAYSLQYKKNLFPACRKAFSQGWQKGKQEPKCTYYNG